MEGRWIARVYILDNIPYHIDKPYDYLLPDDLRDAIRAGAFVAVPFGRGDKKRRALVCAVERSDGEPAVELKPVSFMIEREPPLSPEQLELCLYIKEHTFCTVGEAVRTMIPQQIAEKYAVYAEATEAARDYVEGEAKLRSPVQQRVLCDMSLCGRISVQRLRTEFGASPAQIRSLADKGLIRLTRYDEYRDPSFAAGSARPENVLNGEQSAALQTLISLLNTGEPRAALLHGVTGSGKTRVIIALTEEVLSRGRQAVILVPEIALTPQTLGLFSSFFGDRIAVMHSSLSAGERYDAWRRMKTGKASVCIGTRSAVFAPFENVGLIVIDEEQEHTYKSDNDPKYNAVDVARFRCAKNGALLLLASATPSLGSYHKAVTGKYTLIELNSRYGEAVLPEARIYDMRDEYRAGNLGSIGSLLKKELTETMEAGKQAIIFINRRGYNHYVSCPQCGTVMICPHCSVSLTNHTVRGRGELRCHYCGFRARTPDKCPNCGGEHLNFVGYGTQKVEEELNALFPDKKIIRMDADTTGTKSAHDEILQAFRRHEGDSLLGTQMVTKGHDFPDVTLSGILLADMSLYLDDFRANERTFSLVTQVVGRAGRSTEPGRAVIQTFNPDHPVLRMASRQDYKEFYRNEAALRKQLVFPPFCDMVLISFRGRSESDVHRCAEDLAKELKKRIGSGEKTPMTVFGPIEAPIYRINEQYRVRLVIKCRSNAPTRAVFSELLADYLKKYSKKVDISIDVNPNSL